MKIKLHAELETDWFDTDNPGDIVVIYFGDEEVTRVSPDAYGISGRRTRTTHGFYLSAEERKAEENRIVSQTAAAWLKHKLHL